jgi:hypothetical protein
MTVATIRWVVVQPRWGDLVSGLQKNTCPLPLVKEEGTVIESPNIR